MYKSIDNFDDYDNSIVDSLSEMSVASTAMMNATSHELLHKTISEVISLYLWSNDFNYTSISSDENSFKEVGHNDVQIKKNAWDNNSNNNNLLNVQIKQFTNAINTINDEDLENETPKASPRRNNSIGNLAKKQNSTQNDSKFIKDSESLTISQQKKHDIPLLDFTTFNSDTKTRRSNEYHVSSKSLDLQSKHNSNLKSLDGTKKTSLTSNKILLTLHIIKNIVFKDINKIDDQMNINKKPIAIKTNKQDIKLFLKELKFMRITNDSSVNEYYDDSIDSKYLKKDFRTEKFNQMENDLRDLLARLIDKRKNSKRTHDLERMTKDEVQAEKVDTQKELLTFEGKHGRPQTKMEKDLMRPLYDHYRRVKRLLSNESNVHDEDAMNDDGLFKKEHIKSYSGQYTSYSSNELIIEREKLLREKSKLKEIIKKHEADFIQVNGRTLMRDDRDFYKEDYDKYKNLKSRIKQIESLINKNN